MFKGNGGQTVSNGSKDNISDLGKNTQFSKENQPRKRGRKPAKWKKFTKDFDISDKDREYMAQVILSAKSKDDIFKMVKDNKIPFGVWAASIAAIADAKKGGTGFLKYLFDAAFGKLPEKTEISGHLDHSKMSEEDIKNRIDELIKKRQEESNEEKNNKD